MEPIDEYDIMYKEVDCDIISPPRSPRCDEPSEENLPSNVLTGKDFQNLTKKARKLGVKSLDYSPRKGNKYVATLPDGKKVHFGSPKYPDYLIHEDDARKERDLGRARKIKNKK